MQLHRRAWLMGAGASALAACGTSPRGLDLAPSIFNTSEANQVSTFANADMLGPSRVIARGGPPSRLVPMAAALTDIRYTHEGAAKTLDQYVAENRVGAMVVIKSGALALERYAMGLDARTRWQGFSMAKPITSTLAGAALADGAIASLDDPMERYASAYIGSAYEGVTVRNLLRLMSGVGWDEDYNTSEGGGIVGIEAAVASGDRGAMRRMMRSRPRAAEQGTVFNYNTGEAFVLGEVISGATGKTLAGYLSEKFWRPMGAEHDAYWLTCGAGGQEMGGYGVSATARDFARFGLAVKDDGVIGGQRVLPVGWRDLAGQPDNPVTANGALDEGYPLGHAYMWWSMPTGADALPGHDGAFTAQGLNGQILYINAKEDVVAVILSAWREGWETPREMETWSMLGEAIARLR